MRQVTMSPWLVSFRSSVDHRVVVPQIILHHHWNLHPLFYALDFFLRRWTQRSKILAELQIFKCYGPVIQSQSVVQNSTHILIDSKVPPPSPWVDLPIVLLCHQGPFCTISRSSNQKNIILSPPPPTSSPRPECRTSGGCSCSKMHTEIGYHKLVLGMFTMLFLIIGTPLKRETPHARNNEKQATVSFS